MELKCHIVIWGAFTNIYLYQVSIKSLYFFSLSSHRVNFSDTSVMVLNQNLRGSLFQSGLLETPHTSLSITVTSTLSCPVGQMTQWQSVFTSGFPWFRALTHCEVYRAVSLSGYMIFNSEVIFLSALWSASKIHVAQRNTLTLFTSGRSLTCANMPFT